MILAGIAALLWLLGFVFLFRIPVCRDRRVLGDRPTVSVIIPARNEESTLPTLLDSLATQDERAFEIIVVDDESEDATATLARDGGARVLDSAPLPEGWRGKTWACQQGADEARGDLFLFVDADTCFESGGIRRLVNAYLQRPGVLSVCPYHRVPRLYEQLSAFFNLTMMAGIGAFSLFGQRVKNVGLFGQVLLVDRAAYSTVGGHAAVRDRILENLCLADRFREAGISMQCRGGRHTVTMRMYPHGARDLADGWVKAFASGASKTPPLLLFVIVAWITGAMVAVLSLVLCVGNVWVWALLYGFFAVQIHTMLRRIGSFRILTSLLFPVPLFFYFVVFTRSVFCKTTTWKGRSIPLSKGGES